MYNLVLDAFKRQKERKQPTLNGKLEESQIEQFCILTQEATTILNRAIDNFSLSHRSINSIKKVARTIADINQNQDITKKDILEALSYRKR
jgi:magnesium chelatase family protein